MGKGKPSSLGKGVFDHPWETATTTAEQKYPNPRDLGVLGVGVLDKHIDASGNLHSHRLTSQHRVGTAFHCEISYWCRESQTRVQEHSVIGPLVRTGDLKFTNMSLTSSMSVEERLTDKPRPQDPE